MQSLSEKEKKDIIDYFEECIKKENLFEDDLTLRFMQKAVTLIREQQEENEKLNKRLLYNMAKGLNNNLKEAKKHSEELNALNEGWKIENAELQKELDLANKIINEMAKSMAKELPKNNYSEDFIKEFFRKKVTKC